MKKVRLIFLMVMTIFVTNQLQAEELYKVYQKEISFLTAQKRELEKQIVQQRSRYKKKIIRAEKDVKKRQNQLVSLSTLNEQSVNKLSELERTLENYEVNKSLIETTTSQAMISLGINEEEISNKKQYPLKLQFIFNSAFNVMDASQRIISSKGEFFLESGKKVQSDIISYGKVAKFGKVDGKYKMLIPAGGEKFKVYTSPSSRNVQLSEQKLPSELPMFLFESSSKAISMKKEQSFLEMIAAGGSIAWVIVWMGGLAFVLMLFRGILLFRAGRKDDEINKKIQIKDIVFLKDAVSKAKTPYTRVIQKTLSSIDKEQDERESVIQESILSELNLLDKFGAAILVMAAVAPLLGLLGTVTGMISTFDIITEFGTGDPKLLSSGISEALITTKLGLVVAIPTLLMGNLFSGWSNKIKIMLEREALRISNFASELKCK